MMNKACIVFSPIAWQCYKLPKRIEDMGVFTIQVHAQSYDPVQQSKLSCHIHIILATKMHVNVL